MWTVAPLDTTAIAQTATSHGYTGITPLVAKHSNHTTSNALQSIQQCIGSSSSSSDGVAATSAHAWSASWLPHCANSMLVCMSNGELLRLETVAAAGRCSATVLLRAHAGRLSGLETVPLTGSANSLLKGSEFVTVSKVRSMHMLCTRELAAICSTQPCTLLSYCSTDNCSNSVCTNTC
jgi:hypothetical protein